MQGQVDPPLHAGRIEAFRGLNLAAQIALLADREEIRDLIATYAHRAAHRLPMADLFTEDGAFINRPDPDAPAIEVRGRAALNRYFDDLRNAPHRPLPMLHNFLIAVDGDTARSMSSMEVRIPMADRVMQGSGYYEDRLTREEGVWKFAERDMTMLSMVTSARPPGA